MYELYVIVFAKNRKMVGRRAYRTRTDAEEYLKYAYRSERYAIERYVLAPLEERK